ncbi:MAG TPA: hypothetical protein PKL59_16960 [Nitrospira sp.]|nr:hypothetical protein [Nitrospira sp.]
MTVHIVSEHVAYPSKHDLLRLFTCRAWTGINGLFASLLSDSATEGSLDVPLFTATLVKGEVDVTPHNANILRVVGGAKSIERAHGIHPSGSAY